MKREISPANWNEFLQDFSRRYRGRRARIEVTAPLGEGGPLVEEYRPLKGVELRGGACGMPEIVLMLEDREAERFCLTYAITDPVRLSVEEEPSGLVVGLEIRSVEGDESLLRFEPAPASFERLPIAVGLERSHGRDHPPPERL
jgi:hypothetical protein